MSPGTRTGRRLLLLSTTVGLAVHATVAKGNRATLHGREVVAPLFSVSGGGGGGGVNEYVYPTARSEGGREVRGDKGRIRIRGAKGSDLKLSLVL